MTDVKRAGKDEDTYALDGPLRESFRMEPSGQYCGHFYEEENIETGQGDLLVQSFVCRLRDNTGGIVADNLEILR